MTYLHYLFSLLFIFGLTSCDFEKTAKMQSNLPKANGKAGEIIVVMDSTQWGGKVGEEVRSIFGGIVPYLPRQEPTFFLNHIDPISFKSILKLQKNIIIVTVLGDKSKGNKRLKSHFTEKSLKMIQDDPSLFMFPKKDEFAKGQEILHLFGESEELLINNIATNKNKLQKIFVDIEAKRFYKSLYTAKGEDGISNHIHEKLNCDLKVPLGYNIALEDDNFIWLRNLSPDIDKNVFVSWVDYSSEDVFSLEGLLKLRTDITKPYILYKPEDPESYLLTEVDNFSVFRKELNFKGQYAVEIRGLWKVNKYYMGGPFIGYAMVDESTNRLYYVEAFLYSPGKPQRDIMRELTTIIKTFKVGNKPA